MGALHSASLNGAGMCFCGALRMFDLAVLMTYVTVLFALSSMEALHSEFPCIMFKVLLLKT